MEIDRRNLDWACQRLGLTVQSAAGVVYVCRVPREAGTWTIRDTMIATYAPTERALYADEIDLVTAIRGALQQGGRA